MNKEQIEKLKDRHANGLDCDNATFGELLAAATPSPAVAVEPVESDEDNWRRLALQFDGHRMQALSHLRAMLQDSEKHAPLVRKFLAAPPLSGEEVLAQRLATPSPSLAVRDVVELTDDQIIKRAGEIFGFKPHDQDATSRQRMLDFARWCAAPD